MNNDITDAKLLASSITDALDILYRFSVASSGNSLDELNKIDSTIFTIQAAAERLSEMMEVLV